MPLLPFTFCWQVPALANDWYSWAEESNTWYDVTHTTWPVYDTVFYISNTFVILTRVNKLLYIAVYCKDIQTSLIFWNLNYHYTRHRLAEHKNKSQHPRFPSTFHPYTHSLLLIYPYNKDILNFCELIIYNGFFKV